MNDKEKEFANKLISSFSEHADWNNEFGSQEKKANTEHSKMCALICIDEIMKSNPMKYSIDFMRKVKREIKRFN